MSESLKRCNDCGNKFLPRGIAVHWSLSDCESPKISTIQREMLTGLMMGDGSLGKRDTHSPRVEVMSTSEKYLKWLNNQFPQYGRGVSLHRTADQATESLKKFSGKNTKANPIYRWYTSYSPRFGFLTKFYREGEKRYPYSSLELTPEVLRQWYVGDGHLEGNWNIIIAVQNERENEEELRRLFGECGFEITTFNKGDMFANIRFGVEESIEIFEWIGEPVPGFGHKWRKEV